MIASELHQRSGEDAIFSLEPAAAKHIAADYLWVLPAANTVKEKNASEERRPSQISKAQEEEK